MLFGGVCSIIIWNRIIIAWLIARTEIRSCYNLSRSRSWISHGTMDDSVTRNLLSPLPLAVVLSMIDQNLNAISWGTIRGYNTIIFLLNIVMTSAFFKEIYLRVFPFSIAITILPSSSFYFEIIKALTLTYKIKL